VTTTIAAPDRAPVREVVPAASRWWYVVLAGALIGIVGTSWQTVERIAYAADGAGESFCDISSVLSCSSVYSHWQSSALGIPNSLVGLPVFAFLASAAVSALLGSRLSPVFVRTALGMSLFMTAFVVWYLQQTAMEIGALCLFCLACMVSLTLTSSGLVRVADAESALGSGRVATRVHSWVDSWVDLAAWAGLAMLVAAMLVLGLAV
jgi:uncharacterized membrane protein